MFNGHFINRIVILTGAGVSAESGIATFRDADGLFKYLTASVAERVVEMESDEE